MSGQHRIESIDYVRGIVMVLMALDHVRDFFSSSAIAPDYTAPAAIFLTRWITHFCAPTFVFLAGISAFLYGKKVASIHSLSKFLFWRGTLLVLLEVTIVRMGWTFHPGFEFILLQVIWAIGISMVLLSGFVWLPIWVTGISGLVMILGHNLLDGIHPTHFEQIGWIWNLLHQPGVILYDAGTIIYVAYPLIPWIGVMLGGYCFGLIMTATSDRRQRFLFIIGTGMLLLFFILRYYFSYGDPFKWFAHDSIIKSVFAFMDCTKYPPSLEFLLMTIGPMIIVLAILQNYRGKLMEFLKTFGRAPLLFYLIHLPLIHGVAVILEMIREHDAQWLFQGFPPSAKPPYYGYAIHWVYLIWILIIIVMYPICRFLSSKKHKSRSQWASYF